MNSVNGGLEVVDGSHRMDIPLGSDRCIEPTWVKMNTWTPAELESGRYISPNLGRTYADKDRRYFDLWLIPGA
jgi:hypothetical protein